MIACHVLSDLHLEFGTLELPERVRSGADAELVLLAGDIHIGRRAVPWAAQTFVQRVAVIGGNHEAYGDSLWASIAAAREQAAEASRDRAHEIRYLERETWSFKARDGTPVRVLGCTLWTDFGLDGGVDARDRAMAIALRDVNDYAYIKVKDADESEGRRRLLPSDTLHLHQLSRRWLEETLAERFDGVTIVMTHHAPSRRSLADGMASRDTDSCYASDLDHLVEASGAVLWAHGHIHASSDYMLGGTRVVCNPRGYWPRELNPDFDPGHLVAVDGLGSRAGIPRVISLERIALVDCEASSLGPASYPIEVGWCLADTAVVESHLIVPMNGWSDWDPEAEAVHGINRQVLIDQGRPVAEVARRMREALEGRDLYADGTRDQRWIDRLFDAAGLPSLALRHFDQLLDAVVKPELEASDDWLARELGRLSEQGPIVDEAYARARLVAAPTHRAGDDARHLCEVLRQALSLQAEPGPQRSRRDGH